MTLVVAIDPGTVQSAMVVYDVASGAIPSFARWTNRQMLGWLRGEFEPIHEGVPRGTAHLVIERVESFGMAVGAEVFDTVYWSGRFAEAAHPLPVTRIGRKAVKIHLCGSMRAKDPNIRQALIDRYGGPDAIGRKASPGPLYGVSGDVWSALAVAVTWADTRAAA